MKIGFRHALLAAITASPLTAQVTAEFAVKNGNEEFGRFIAQLDYLASPHAVANFIRLAEGLVPWIDSTTGEVTTGPFYDGLTFHSTAAGFEVACGSRSGEGDDGPGWTIRDDFSSTPSPLFAIYMENDGPNSNGSRFFINLTSGLNPLRQGGRYTTLGLVLAPTQGGGLGRSVVAAIANSPEGFLTLDSVTLTYSGNDPQKFRQGVVDPNHHSLWLLPSARRAAFRFRHQPGSLFLDWDDTPGSGILLWSSFDLRTWSGPFPAFNVPGSTEFGFDLSSTLQLTPKGFFRGGVIEYPHWPSTERPLANAGIQTGFIDPNRGNVITNYSFDATGRGGSYLGTFGAGEFTVTSEETTGPYATEVVLTPDSGNLPTYRLTLHYDLDWSTSSPVTALPILANPSRLDGFEVNSPNAKLINGGWTYAGAP